MKPEYKKSLNKWSLINKKLGYDLINRTATKKHVYVGVMIEKDILEITVSNNPAISTKNSLYYWSERPELKNEWLNIKDENIDLLNIIINQSLDIKKVVCKWVDIIDMISVNIMIDKNSDLIWEDQFNHSDFNVIERYWNLKNVHLNYSNRYNDSKNLLWINDIWTIENNVKVNYCDFLTQKYIRRLSEFYLESNSILNYVSTGFINEKNNYENIININHINEKSISNINIKGFVFDESKIKVDCIVNIKNKAIESLTEQNIKYWMLSDKGAIIEVSPQLHVYTEDVIKANHGAAIGNLDKDIIDYMKSRGINIHEIFKLIIHGILNESISIFFEENNLITVKDEKLWIDFIYDEVKEILKDDIWIESAISYWVEQYNESEL